METEGQVWQAEEKEKMGREEGPICKRSTKHPSHQSDCQRKVLSSQCRTEEAGPGKFRRECEKKEQIFTDCARRKKSNSMCFEFYFCNVRSQSWGYGLSGTIAPEIGNLAKLQALMLYDNKLTGPIPDSLGNLKSLQYLYLENNYLCGRALWEALAKLANYHNLRRMTLWPNPNLCNPLKSGNNNCSAAARSCPPNSN